MEIFLHCPKFVFRIFINSFESNRSSKSFSTEEIEKRYQKEKKRPIGHRSGQASSRTRARPSVQAKPAQIPCTAQHCFSLSFFSLTGGPRGSSSSCGHLFVMNTNSRNRTNPVQIFVSRLNFFTPRPRNPPINTPASTPFFFAKIEP
jgi:hypothetical protein